MLYNHSILNFKTGVLNNNKQTQVEGFDIESSKKI